MERLVKFATDTATLAIFDPVRMAHRFNDKCDWWCGEFRGLAELKSGAMVLASLGADGIYDVRITDGDLTQDERDYAADAIYGLGVEVISEKLFIGPGECVPGGGSTITDGDLDRGALLSLENGAFSCDLYAISWFDSPRWWTDKRNVPTDAPADFVVVLRPRTTPFVQIDSSPRLDVCGEEFLFPSATRLVGPQPGMLLSTTVRNGGRGELCLKNCGPRDYKASLVDYVGLEWKDRIRLRVLTVNHENRELVGEFVEKVPS